jgi:hypothetical protein
MTHKNIRSDSGYRSYLDPEEENTGGDSPQPQIHLNRRFISPRDSLQLYKEKWLAEEGSVGMSRARPPKRVRAYLDDNCDEVIVGDNDGTTKTSEFWSGDPAAVFGAFLMPNLFGDNKNNTPVRPPASKRQYLPRLATSVVGTAGWMLDM